MEANIMERYYRYMEDSSELRVGVYEAEHLAEICGLAVTALLLLGVMANAQKAPVQLKTGWYIYRLDERIFEGKPVCYISIDNNLKYI